MSGETALTIVGNLTADPEPRVTGSGVSVVNFTIAATPRMYNRQSNQWEDGPALFLRCSAWRDLADNIARSLSKGMRVIAQGRLSQHSYQAQDGSNRTVVEMTVDEIGPSLRYAQAAVVRTDQGQRTGYAPPPASQPMTPPQQSAPPSAPPAEGDPWGQPPIDPFNNPDPEF